MEGACKTANRPPGHKLSVSDLHTPSKSVGCERRRHTSPPRDHQTAATRLNWQVRPCGYQTLFAAARVLRKKVGIARNNNLQATDALTNKVIRAPTAVAPSDLSDL